MGWLCRMQYACGMRKVSEIVMRKLYGKRTCVEAVDGHVNALRTGDADLHFYVTTVQDG